MSATSPSQRSQNPQSPQSPQKNANKILHLRASIKILVSIGFIFLLVPFLKSLPWMQNKISADSILLTHAQLSEGRTTPITLITGSRVFVTRNSDNLQKKLSDFPAEFLWSPTAPGLLTQDYFVVSALSAQNEPLTFLPAHGAWQGGFIAESGAAWDLAGRALKPWPAHPTGYVGNIQNLLPMPQRAHESGVLLMPPPS